MAEQHEMISRMLSQKQNDMSTEQTLMNNRMSQYKEELEKIENEKSHLMTQRDTIAKEKS